MKCKTKNAGPCGLDLRQMCRKFGLWGSFFKRWSIFYFSDKSERKSLYTSAEFWAVLGAECQGLAQKVKDLYFNLV
mgnify:FL=1